MNGRRQEDIPGRRTTDRVSAVTGSDTSIRVSVGKVDTMINLVGELVITQAMLAEIVSGMDAVLHERLVNGLAQLERNTRDLQDSVMSVRMMPINLVFSRFQRVVRDSAGKLNKKVQLKIIGEGTELDKGLIEKISDPLTHLVRNSLDHGIEFPDDRIALGKDPQGTITLRAAHQGGSIIIEVSDDGAGLNRERILAKAKERGMPVSEGMSDAEVWQLIFAPGFSTANSHNGCFRPRCRHGRGQEKYREHRRPCRSHIASRTGQHRLHPPAAYTGHSGWIVSGRW